MTFLLFAHVPLCVLCSYIKPFSAFVLLLSACCYAKAYAWCASFRLFFFLNTHKSFGVGCCVLLPAVSHRYFLRWYCRIYLLHGNLGKIRIKEGRGKPFGPVLLWLLCGGHAKLVLTTVKKHCIKSEAFWTTPELSGWEGTTLGQKYFTSLCNLYYYVFIFLLPDHKVFIARDTKKRRIRGMYFTQYFVTSDKSVVQVEHISELC